MITDVLKLSGNVVGISNGDLCCADKKQAFLYVKGSSSLYVEFQLPNGHEWVLGQEVVVLVIPMPEGKSSSSVDRRS